MTDTHKGSYFANVLKMLKRICKYYNSKPQFLNSSATIANLIELAGIRESRKKKDESNISNP